MGLGGPEGDVGAQGLQGTPGTQGLISHNLALGRVTSNTSHQDGYGSSNAVDNDIATSWLSASTNIPTSQLFGVDLGASYNINEVKLFWAGPNYASQYRVQVSNDTINWTDLYSTTNSVGGIENLTGLSGSGRYILVTMLVPANATVGFKEVQVFGTPLSSRAFPSPTSIPTPLPPAPTPTPNGGS